MNIKVLGTGCANCKNTMDLIDQVAKDLGTAITLEKVEDLAQIMQYGVMTTPGVVIDEKVVHAGGIPEKAVIEGWLQGATDGVSGSGQKDSCCGGGCGG
jgi:small redox-active disulfide protein 2